MLYDSDNKVDDLSFSLQEEERKAGSYDFDEENEQTEELDPTFSASDTT